METGATIEKREVKDNSPSADELLEKIRETESRVAELINQIANPERTIEEKIRLNIHRGSLKANKNYRALRGAIQVGEPPAENDEVF